MPIKHIPTALVVIAALFVGVSSADAAPLKVDCDLLEATNDAVDDFLDAQGIAFDNLGDFVSSAIQDDGLYDQFRALILLFSGGEIDFESPSQMVGTNAMCGLLPQLNGNFAD